MSNDFRKFAIKLSQDGQIGKGHMFEVVSFSSVTDIYVDFFQKGRFPENVRPRGAVGFSFICNDNGWANGEQPNVLGSLIYNNGYDSVPGNIFIIKTGNDEGDFLLTHDEVVAFAHLAVQKINTFLTSKGSGSEFANSLSKALLLHKELEAFLESEKTI